MSRRGTSALDVGALVKQAGVALAGGFDAFGEELIDLLGGPADEVLGDQDPGQVHAGEQRVGAEPGEQVVLGAALAEFGGDGPAVPADVLVGLLPVGAGG